MVINLNPLDGYAMVQRVQLHYLEKQHPSDCKAKAHEAYLSHVKIQITASRKDIYLVLVYGITDHPMMLATNKGIKSKDDVINVNSALRLLFE